jgi:hypothetical protein
MSRSGGAAAGGVLVLCDVKQQSSVEVLMRSIVALALLTLAACGEADLEKAKQGAIDIGQGALELAANAVDLRTACTLAGQSEAFCGCVQDRLGADISPETVEAISTVIRRAVAGEGMEAAAEGATGMDQPTRDALVQCSVQAGTPTTAE